MKFTIEIEELAAGDPRNRLGYAHIRASIVKDNESRLAMESAPLEDSSAHLLHPEYAKVAAIRNFFSALGSVMGEQMYSDAFPKYKADESGILFPIIA